MEINTLDLKTLRKNKNITLDYLSSKLNMSKSNLSLIENNKRRISLIDYKSALEVLGYKLYIIDEKSNDYNININIKGVKNMLNKKIYNLMNFIDNNFFDLKLFLLELDYDASDEDDMIFIDEITYLVENDKTVCELLNNLISKSKELTKKDLDIIDDICDDVFDKINKIGLEKRDTYLENSNGEFLDDEDSNLYVKHYKQLNDDIITIVYDTNIFQVGYIKDIEDENLEIKPFIQLTRNGDIKDINTKLLNLFDENTLEDIKNTIFKVYDAESIYSKYICGVGSIIDKIQNSIR